MARKWPSGLRDFNWSWEVSSSNSRRCLAKLRDPTLLRGSRWPSGWNCKNAVINIGMSKAGHPHSPLSLYLSLYLSVSLSVCLSLSLSLCLSVSVSLSLCLSVCLSVSLSLSLSFFWPYLLPKSKEESYRPSILQDFLLLEENNSETAAKVAAAKKVFSSVCSIVTSCFDKRFSVYVITGRHCFFYERLLMPSIATYLCSFEQVIRKKSDFTFHLQNNSTILIPKWKVPEQISKKSSRISYFLSFCTPFNFWCSTFLFKWKVFNKL